MCLETAKTYGPRFGVSSETFCPIDMCVGQIRYCRVPREGASESRGRPIVSTPAVRVDDLRVYTPRIVPWRVVLDQSGTVSAQTLPPEQAENNGFHCTP